MDISILPLVFGAEQAVGSIPAMPRALFEGQMIPGGIFLQEKQLPPLSLCQVLGGK